MQNIKYGVVAFFILSLVGCMSNPRNGVGYYPTSNDGTRARQGDGVQNQNNTADGSRRRLREDE